MPVGSHKDAFKAHQLVKKLVSKDGDTPLAARAADILLDFVKSQRQINQRETEGPLPVDRTSYDSDKLSAALDAVGSLCGLCEEAHSNACFVNQARRVLIAAKTGIDLGGEFDGKKSLSDLLKEAELLAAEGPSRGSPGSTGSPRSREIASAGSAGVCGKAGVGTTDSLRFELEALREREVFRGTLIDEIESTIRKIAEGNYAAKMPIHEDEQLGKLAGTFNLMLDAMNRTMAHLDQLVNSRNSELKRIMNTVPVGLLSVNPELRVNPEYSQASERILQTEDLRGRDFLDLLGLTQRREADRKALRDFLELKLMGISSPDMDRLNPFPELELPKGSWIRLQYHPVDSPEGIQGLLVELEDITENKRLVAKVESTQRESAQIKAIAEAPDLFRDFLEDITRILEASHRALDGLESASDARSRIDEVFRGIHTIKGTAGGFGMSEVEKHAGVLETSLNRAREGSPPLFPRAEISENMDRLCIAVGEAKRLSALILGDDQATAGPVLHVSSTLVNEFKGLIGSLEMPQESRTRLFQAAGDMEKVTALKGFERSTRIVPGLISRLGKRVSFSVEGGDTAIPYQLARELNGPLTHLLRNAFDHGIETEEQRRSVGKSPEGSVTLFVRRTDQGYEVGVRDDGKGLKPDLLRESAVRKGILTGDSARTLTDEECLGLIFRPGFSTATTVSDVSGRGVGMDAVQQTIEGLGGEISTESLPGKGSTFILRVPDPDAGGSAVRMGG